MFIEYPEEYRDYTIQELLDNKIIVHSKDNNAYRNSIFPMISNVDTTDNFVRDRIITKIDDEFFKDFKILDKMTQIVYNADKTKRKLIKAKEFGDIYDSFKRYNNVNFPISHNTDSKTFLHINDRKQMFFKNNIDNDDLKFNDMGYKNILHKSNKLPQVKDTTNKYNKFNDKTTIEYVLKKAKEFGIKYIYCIVEYRPYIIDKRYTSNFCYYTVIGYGDWENKQ